MLTGCGGVLPFQLEVVATTVVPGVAWLAYQSASVRLKDWVVPSV